MEEQNNQSLKQRTAQGLFWGAMNSGTTQILNLAFGIVLGRLLSPDEYGIVGVLTIFTAIAADLQSSGFTQGLVNRKRIDEKDYNAVFTFNVGMSAGMYAILFFASPLIAEFFHQPCLTIVSRVVFLTFLIASLGIAHGGYMAKRMMNREIAIIGFLALLTSGGTGITLACLGYGYWSLAWQQVAYVTVITLGRYFFVKTWRPRITLRLTPIREMAPFAMNILVTKIVTTLSNNLLTVIFGRLFPIHQVGNYSQAFKWDTMASSLVSNTVGQVAQPVLYESNAGNEKERQLRVFRKMVRFTSFLSMPLMFGLAIISREFILLTIGSEWEGCVLMLQILCLSGAFLPIHTMYQNLAISRGKSNVFMWLSLAQIVLQLLIILSTHRFGMTVMVCAYSLLIILWLLPWHFFVSRMTGYRWCDVAKDIVPFMLVALAVMAVTFLATTSLSSLYLQLALRIFMAAVLYATVMYIGKVEILNECIQFIKRKG